MSLLRRIGRIVGRVGRGIGRIAPMLPGPIGTIGQIGALLPRRPGPMPVPIAAPLLPAAPAIGRAVGFAVGRVARSAATYCRRHPQWCATIGGLAAVEALLRGGQLPLIKRRRAKGITGTELRNFRRVSSVLNKWCKIPPPTRPRRRGSPCQ